MTEKSIHGKASTFKVDQAEVVSEENIQSNNIISLESWKEVNLPLSDQNQKIDTAKKLLERAKDLIKILAQPEINLSPEILGEGREIMKAIIFELNLENEPLLADQLGRELENMELSWRKLTTTETLANLSLID